MSAPPQPSPSHHSAPVALPIESSVEKSSSEPSLSGLDPQLWLNGDDDEPGASYDMDLDRPARSPDNTTSQNASPPLPPPQQEQEQEQPAPWDIFDDLPDDMYVDEPYVLHFPFHLVLQRPNYCRFQLCTTAQRRQFEHQ